MVDMVIVEVEVGFKEKKNIHVDVALHNSCMLVRFADFRKSDSHYQLCFLEAETLIIKLKC